jgi:peptidyl-tRNA hydrolase, PTH1 family
MKLIIGLGNPGKIYEKTRHNTGFIILEELRKILSFPDFELNKKFNAETSEGNYKLPACQRLALSDRQTTNNKLILARPQTFMNNSGEAVRKIMDFYKLTPDDIFVIHDDLDIERGKYKIATDSSSAGHNGVQNIIDILGTQKFRRARVGISQSAADITACRLDAHNYVLDKFSDGELMVTKNLAEKISNNL